MGVGKKITGALLALLVVVIAGCGGFTYHRVEPGETLYSISWRYGLDYRQVANWNHIPTPYTIFNGQLLRITPPGGAGAQQQGPAPVVTARSAAPVSNRPTTPSVATPAHISPSGPLHWQWPASGHLLQTFSTEDLTRKGIDIGGRLGEPVRAAAGGSVVYAGSGLLNYGKLIIIKHDDNYLSAYAYNSSLLVKEGEQVAAGQHIADMGNKAHGDAMLHFEIRYDGRPINPLKYLPLARQ